MLLAVDPLGDVVFVVDPLGDVAFSGPPVLLLCCCVLPALLLSCPFPLLLLSCAFTVVANIARIKIPDTAKGVITNLEIGLCSIYRKTLSATVKNLSFGSAKFTAIKRCRRLLIRWEKELENYRDRLHFACTCIIYRVAGLFT